MDGSDYNGLDQLKTTEKATSTPLLKDLYEYITPQCGADWKVIGTLLGLPSEELKIIECDNHYKAASCCNAMLDMWLEVDPSASWEKLFKAIESPAVSSDQAPDKGVSLLSDRVRQLNAQTRFAVDVDAWPPNQPQDFIPLLLIHHEDQHNPKHATVLQLAKAVQIGGACPKHCPQVCRESLRKALNNSKITKRLEDILIPLQENNDAQFILVEGLPGIGKTLLLQEIAYNWAMGRLLQKFKLVFLVQLRNPVVQKITLIADLLQLFCMGDTRVAEVSSSCSDYVLKNKGTDLVFLFDGFDEFPESLQKNSLIASILSRQILPCCGLVMSSRPHASVRLRDQASVRVDILGFAEEERKLYIEQSLKGHPCAIKELAKYLEDNLTISSLCYIPFNMVVLIYLYKQGIPLPSNSTELYNYFIYLTVCRHLGHSLENTVLDLANLPEPSKTIIKRLSELSFKGLNDNKVIFTLQEVREACPDITAIPGAVNGFGLLQAIQHFGLTGKTMTFNFVHYSIQEFLAAYHITLLPPQEELLVLRTKFWSNLHSNMFAMYTSLTKGQRSAFKLFLSGGDDRTTISKRFLTDQLRCLRLFNCLNKAGSETVSEIITIEKANIFDQKIVNLHKTSLSPYDVECVALFLTSSPHKEWEDIDLNRCHIQDHGLRVFYHKLFGSDITIGKLNLWGNGFTLSSSSFISDLTIQCKVEELRISGNHTIGDDPALYNMLSHPSSTLLTLYMSNTELSSAATIALFNALVKGNKLQLLIISLNNITDEACDVIAASLKKNTSLVGLEMDRNDKISVKAAQCIVQALSLNNTLELLQLPYYPKEDQRKIRCLQGEVVNERESRGCPTKLDITFV
ncbi:protein NLRC5-like isoform X2 [Dysidea avara]|uniref:protein NLRC5-like isoform X2 n=1 Tax=Dysidea avara TaxID=196820 RepID=UPI00332600E5